MKKIILFTLFLCVHLVAGAAYAAIPTPVPPCYGKILWKDGAGGHSVMFESTGYNSSNASLFSSLDWIFIGGQSTSISGPGPIEVYFGPGWVPNGYVKITYVSGDIEFGPCKMI